MRDLPSECRSQLVFDDLVMPFADLLEQARRLAAWLQAEGIHCLAMSLANGRGNLAVYLAGEWADCTVLAINPRLTAAELQQLLSVQDARLLLLDAERITPALQDFCRRRGMRLIAAGRHFFDDDSDFARTLRQTRPLAQPLPMSAQRGVVHFTSGTLGEYKGAWHSYAQCADYALRMAQDMRYDDDETLLIALSANHAMAFSYQWLPARARGLNLVVLPGFDLQAVLEALQRHAVTSLALLPTMAYWVARALLERQLRPPALRSVFVAGDALPLAMRQTMRAAFGCEPVVGIGMTESFGYCLNFAGEDKPAASGTAVAGFEIRIADAGDRPLPPGEAGEIQLRGPGLMQRYEAQPALTRDSLVDGWLRSGDLGQLDEDGCLWFHGRRKQIIISAGSNIAPLEVEAAMYRHPAVLEAVVTAAPDVEYQQIPVAYVATLEQSDLDEAQLKQFLRDYLADYKIPRYIRFLPALPKNVTGKLDRAGLTRQAHDDFVTD